MTAVRVEATRPWPNRIGKWIADLALRGIARALKSEAPARKQGLLSTMPAPRPERKGQTHAGY